MAQVVSCASSQISQFKCYLGYSSFEVMKLSWLQDVVWPCDWRNDVIGDGKASAAVQGGHVEKLKLGTMKRGQKRLLIKVQSSFRRRYQHFGDASIMDDHQDYKDFWSGSCRNLEDRLFVLRGKTREVIQVSWRNTGDHESDIDC